MGTWSYALDGSDAAADYTGEVMENLCKVAGIEYSADEGDDYLMREEGFTQEERDKINAHILKNGLEDLIPGDQDDVQSTNALVGIALMRDGLIIPDKFKKDLIAELAGIFNESDEDEERDHCKELIRELKEYKNKPTNVQGPGLIATIVEHIGKGKKGLVNKEPKKPKK